MSSNNNYNFYFRPLSQADAESIIGVHRKSIYGLCKEHYSEEQMRIWTEMFSRRIFDEGMKNPDNIGIVAVEQEVVGYGFINLKDREVKGMYIVPEYAGKGIGQAILSRLEMIAKEHSIDQVSLHSTLNAVPFYEKCGYVKGKEELFTLTGSCSLACVPMHKKL